jgi:hypothetical protein
MDRQSSHRGAAKQSLIGKKIDSDSPEDSLVRGD